tara:strand:+ start:9352 stop:10068 length:717 start_codon:yes stop_codon:yes gene_type:complete
LTDNYAWCLDYLNREKIDIIAEIGSRDGLDSIFLGNYFNASNNYIFEADPSLKSLIEKNLQNSSLDSEHHIFNLALSDEQKIGKFKAVNKEKYENHGIGSFFDINFDNRDSSDVDFQRESVQKEIDIEIQRYDKLNLKTPDLIAMDVQGAELKVLKGFGKDISNTYAIILETCISENYIGGSKLLEIYNFLKKDFKLIKNSRNDSNFKLLLEAYKYKFLSASKYIPDINLLFINKKLS